ncbi:MAG: phospholipid/cholesterol/gamma-HCH transport system substrate-binding protein [Pseudonocardiales bacterium]|jgi:phospholipid/cholesterol/gamma-HCH transport system substrate-binding protein|nr:phospholipid/cholesterol/gamma-HCH transport system substrate-binding protein [Pseudonocardiales bacterium]
MLVRRVKIQLVVFSLLTICALVSVAVNYLDLPRLLGFNQYPIVLQFSDATGLYPSAKVTFRGVPVGTVKGLRLQGRVAVVDVAIDNGVRIPADLRAEAHSSSAVGENYIDLLPLRDQPPYLKAGDVISSDRTSSMPKVGELLTQLTSLAKSLPPKQLDTTLTEVTAAFNGGGPNVRMLLNGGLNLIQTASQNIEPTTQLLRGLGPFLGTQASVSHQLTATVADLVPFTGAVRGADGSLRDLLRHTPPAVDAVLGVVDDIRPDLPILFTDLTNVGRVVKTYIPGIEQVMVIYPATLAATQAALLPPGADPGTVHLEFRPNVQQPRTCYAGYLPVAAQRDFADETTRKSIPTDLYCKVPHNDPRAVRGARNVPCLNAPGRRAASAEECLGVPMGSITDPVPNTRPSAAVATYDPESGRSLMPDGTLIQLGDVGGADGAGKEITSWQQLLVK